MKLRQCMYYLLHPSKARLIKDHANIVAKMPPHIQEAHTHCTNNRQEIDQSDKCGCFCCLSTFAPNEITEWIKNEREEFAMCPKCGIDSVIGNSSGFTINPEFLREMNKHWFDGDVVPLT